MTMNSQLKRVIACGLLALLLGTLRAQTAATAPAAPPFAGPTVLQIHSGQPGVAVSPTLYGLMTEEINYSFDGGLYGELVRNRSFQDDPALPVHWATEQDGGATGAISMDTAQPVSPSLPVSLKMTITGAGGTGGRVGAVNDGFWGIPVRPNTPYRASFYARAADGFTGPLSVSLEGAVGTQALEGAVGTQAIVYARGQVTLVGPNWKHYAVTLTTGKSVPTGTGQLIIGAAHTGTVWLSLVSLFPPTFHNRANGNRIDLMEKLGAMNPSFLRMPGGNYLEGDTIATRFDWKKTLHGLEQRPGHPGPWRYRSSDGMGLLEFLNWCEDLHMQPVLAVFAGYALKREFVPAGPQLQPFVQDALDEIEYVSGSAQTPWGRRRAQDGHPAPFPLTYVEVGNEDNYDRSGSYDGRFAQFYDAIKAKYPKLQIIATTKVQSRTPDVIDEHYYRTADRMANDAHRYDRYNRSGPKIFVGEWASREGSPTPNLNAALGDAAWMTGMERNSDVVVMEAYAPLLVNVNPGGMQWKTDLIGFDTLTSYGSPAYWAQVIFSTNHGNVTVPFTQTDGSPVFTSITRDTKMGTMFIKMVNRTQSPQAVHVSLEDASFVGLLGTSVVAPTGTMVTLSGPDALATNSITDPVHVVPHTSAMTVGTRYFDQSLAPYSISVFRLRVK